MKDQPKRHWFRFGIGTVFIAFLIISVPLASYRLGLEHGRRTGPVIPPDFSAHTIYDREYDISDIVRAKADADMLIDSLKRTAEPKCWDSVGGYAGVKFNSDSSTITVSHIVEGQISVMRYLSLIRDSALGRRDLADVLEDAQLTYNARHKMDDLH